MKNDQINQIRSRCIEILCAHNVFVVSVQAGQCPESASPDAQPAMVVNADQFSKNECCWGRFRCEAQISSQSMLTLQIALGELMHVDALLMR